MPMWQIRVPDALHEAAKARAAEQGKELSDYVRTVVAKDCKNKSLADVKRGRPKEQPKGE